MRYIRRRFPQDGPRVSAATGQHPLPAYQTLQMPKAPRQKYIAKSQRRCEQGFELDTLEMLQWLAEETEDEESGDESGDNDNEVSDVVMADKTDEGCRTKSSVVMASDARTFEQWLAWKQKGREDLIANSKADPNCPVSNYANADPSKRESDGAAYHDTMTTGTANGIVSGVGSKGFCVADLVHSLKGKDGKLRSAAFSRGASIINQRKTSQAWRRKKRVNDTVDANDGKTNRVIANAALNTFTLTIRTKDPVTPGKSVFKSSPVDKSFSFCQNDRDGNSETAQNAESDSDSSSNSSGVTLLKGIEELDIEHGDEDTAAGPEVISDEDVVL